MKNNHCNAYWKRILTQIDRNYGTSNRKWNRIYNVVFGDLKQEDLLDNENKRLDVMKKNKEINKINRSKFLEGIKRLEKRGFQK